MWNLRPNHGRAELNLVCVELSNNEEDHTPMPWKRCLRFKPARKLTTWSFINRIKDITNMQDTVGTHVPIFLWKTITRWKLLWIVKYLLFVHFVHSFDQLNWSLVCRFYWVSYVMHDGRWLFSISVIGWWTGVREYYLGNDLDCLSGCCVIRTPHSKSQGDSDIETWLYSVGLVSRFHVKKFCKGTLSWKHIYHSQGGSAYPGWHPHFRRRLAHPATPITVVVWPSTSRMSLCRISLQ